MLLRQEPIVFRWSCGEVSLGYLGSLRWRVKVGHDSVDASDVQAAVGTAFDTVFRGVSPGDEVAARSPLDLKLTGEHFQFFAQPKFTSGWRFSSRLCEGDVGDHGELLGFVAERVARAAEDAWANGVRPMRPLSLKPEFSFKAFSKATDLEGLCRKLETVLNERLRTHPSPAAAFDKAMKELKAAGHDLWSDIPEEVWGPDYMTSRRGAGLHVTRFTDDEDGTVANTVGVEFKSRVM